MAVLLDGALAVMLACFCPFHIRMALLNETTIEGPSPMFDVGYRKNWQSVFGRDPRLWFLPLYGGGPDGDGVHWPSAYVRAGTDGVDRSQMEEGRLLARGDTTSSESSVQEPD